MGGVDEAPAVVHRGVGEEPVDRALAGPGEAVIDFARLLGDVDVDRAADGGQGRELVEGDGAQRMGREAEHGVVEGGDGGLGGVEEAGEAVEVVDEAELTLAGGLGAEAAVAVEDGEQGEADAGLGGGGGDAFGEFGRVGVGRAAGGVVEVVELGQGGEAGFEHLHHREGGDGFDVVGAQFLQEGVHDLAPGPEAVGAGAAGFGEAGHGTLEGVAVQVGKARQRDPGEALAVVAGGVGGDTGDGPVLDIHGNVVGPAGGEQGGVEEEAAGGHGRLVALRAWTCQRNRAGMGGCWPTRFGRMRGC